MSKMLPFMLMNNQNQIGGNPMLPMMMSMMGGGGGDMIPLMMNMPRPPVTGSQISSPFQTMSQPIIDDRLSVPQGNLQNFPEFFSNPGPVVDPVTGMVQPQPQNPSQMMMLYALMGGEDKEMMFD